MRLLGRRLEPFCLKHRLLLLGFESPLVTGAREITPTDLLMAVQLCAGDRVGKLRWKDHFWMWTMTYNPEIFYTALEAFKRHVGVDRWPKFWEKENTGGSTSGGLSWPIIIVANLVSNGVALDRALVMPECQAIWLNAAFAITNGAKTNVLTTEEEEFIDAQAELATVADPALVKEPPDPSPPANEPTP